MIKRRKASNIDRIGLLITALSLTGLVAGCTSAAPARTQAPTRPATSAGGPLPSAPATTAVPPTAVPADWPSYHGAADRSGVSTTMPPVAGAPRVITRLALDGAVYASPIVIGGITVVATENDTVYAFDRADRQLWKVHLGAPSPAGERPCGNIDPLGITGTPVYAPATGLVYVAPEFSGSPPTHRLVALSLHTGAVAFRRSLDRPGVDPAAMQERGALAVSGRRVYVPFGGLAGDCGAYKGRVVGYSLDGAGAAISYTVPTTREAGIWTPPGPVVDAAGRLYVAVGNGAAGVGDRYDLSDSVLVLSPALGLIDSFSPTSWPTDNDSDLDLGSQGPALVGQWVFSAGKSGTGYVLRRDRLGGVGGQVSSGPVCRSFGGTAVDGDTVYVPCTDGLRAVRIDGAGRLHGRWHADGSVSGSPVVGGGRVWSLDPGGGILYALDPRTGRSTASVAVGATSRFATPAIYGSRLFIPTLAGLTVIGTS